MSTGALTGIMMNERASEIRHRLGDAFAHLRGGGWPILQTAVAVSAAWMLATVDLLRASGMDYTESRETLREAARHAYEEESAAGN